MRGASLLFCGLLAVLAACSTTERATEGDAPPMAMPVPPHDESLSVLEALIAQGRFHKFLGFAQRTGHFETLRDADPLVVLGPTDQAFEAMSREEYVALLEDDAKLHDLIDSLVQPGAIGGDDVKALSQVHRTVVAERDLRCRNGVLLVVGRVQPQLE